MTRKVRVTLGPPYNRGMAIVVPLSWEASSLSALFPVLDGEIEVASIDAEHCRLILSASYTPPLGEVGRSARPAPASWCRQLDGAGLPRSGGGRPRG